MSVIKSLIRAFLILIIFSCIIGTAAGWDGTGTDSDPYQISTWDDFDALRTYTEDGNSDASFRLMNNLDFEDYGNTWIPVGSESKPFNYTFNGSGYIIYNFYLNSATDNAGFFGYAEGAYISNLNFENATVSGKNNVGVLAGKVSQTYIEEIGIYKSAVTASESNAGGIVGCASNPLMYIRSFYSCHVLDSTITAKNNAGGVIGSSVNYEFYKGSLIRSAVTADETSAGGIIGSFEHTNDDYHLYTYDFFVTESSIKSKNDAGGLFGTAGRIRIHYPSVHSSVIYASENNAGGIIGNASSVSVYGDGRISVSGSSITAKENAGGIAGKAVGIYNTSYWNSVDFYIESISVSSEIQAENNSGGIIGYSDHVLISYSNFTSEYNSPNPKATASGNYAGGVVGYAADFTHIISSFSSESVSSQSGAGGIAGYLNNSTVNLSYSTGNVTIGSSGSNAGGLVGIINSSLVEDSYTISDVTGSTNSGGFIGLVESGSQSEILRCYTANPKSGLNVFIGFDEGNDCTVSKSFYLEGGADQTITGLKKLTETEMKSFSPFDDEWNDYPSTIYIDNILSYNHWGANWITVDGCFSPQLSWQNQYNDYVIEIGTNPSAEAGDPGAAEQIQFIGTGEIAKDQTGQMKWWTSKATYIIREDIDMADVIDYNPLHLNDVIILGDKGNGETPTVSNLIVEENYGNYAGLFGYIDNSFVSNIRLHNITVNGTRDVGAFTGCSYNTTFLNCSVTSGRIKGFKVVGGLVGSSTGDTIDYCSFDGTIIGTNDLPAYGQITNISFIGGLAGLVSADSVYDKSSITNSEFSGEISVEFDSNDFELSRWDEGFLVDNIGGLYGGSFLTNDVMTLTSETKALDFLFTPFIEDYYYTGSVSKSISVNEFDSEKLKICLPQNVYVENCSVDADILVRDLTPSELTYYSFEIPGPQIGMIGGLTGSAVASQIENCNVDCEILVEGSLPDNKTLATVTGNVGGLNGMTIFSVINNSSSAGSLTVYGSDSEFNVFTGAVGGLSGMTVLTAVENSYSNESVTVYGGNNDYLDQYLQDLISIGLGDISGQLNPLVPSGISNNFFDAYINSLSTGSVGGLTGLAFFGTVENCYAAGDVEVLGDGAAAIGGLIGLSALELVNDSFVSGNTSVVGSNSVGAGGMFGLFTLGTIEDCYVTGDVLLSDPLSIGMAEDDFTSAGAGGLIGIFLNDGQALGLLASLGVHADIFLDTYVSDSHALNEYVTSPLSGRVIGLNFDVFSYSGSLYFNNLFAWKNMSNEFGTFGFDEFGSGFSENGGDVLSVDVWNKISWINGSHWQLNNYENFLLPIFSWQEKPFIASAEHLIPKKDPGGNNSTGGGDGNATVLPGNSTGGNGTGGAKVIKPETEEIIPSAAFEGDLLPTKVVVLRLFILGIAVWCYRRYDESSKD